MDEVGNCSIAPEVESAVGKHHKTALALSRALYEKPEVGGEEKESSARLVAALRDAGYTVEYPYLGWETAFRAVLRNGDGPETAFLVEYDALPEIGHGCGHNLHGALAVLAGLAMTDLRPLFKGTIHVIGTPAEEVDGAKVDLAAKGAFDGLALAAMIHSSSGGVTQPDMAALSLRNYILEFRGKEAHAVASPWCGHSALAAARAFLALIDARRECFTGDLRFNAVFRDGGKAPNIIPPAASLNIEFRAASLASLDALDEVVKKCAAGAALALEVEHTFTKSYEDFADMRRNLTLECEMAAILRALGENVAEVSEPVGSTDMGNVSYHCPAIQPLLSITSKPYALHTRELAAATQASEAQEAMRRGAAALVTLALKVLKDERFRERVKTEWENGVGSGR